MPGTYRPGLGGFESRARFARDATNSLHPASACAQGACASQSAIAPCPLPALLGRGTAINHEFTAGDKRRLIGGKIQHAIGDIGGRAGSAEGDTP
jgi:hypothetical protein